MNLKKIYSIICLSSLMVFFYIPCVASVEVLQDVFQDYATEQSETDTEKNENKTRIPAPVEEEIQHHSGIVIKYISMISEEKLKISYHYLKWENIAFKIDTPPPQVCL